MPDGLSGDPSKPLTLSPADAQHVFGLMTQVKHALQDLQNAMLERSNPGIRARQGQRRRAGIPPILPPADASGADLDGLREALRPLAELWAGLDGEARERGGGPPRGRSRKYTGNRTAGRRAALNVAVEWGYLTKAPRFRMERTIKRIPRYVTPEHFVLIYDACEVARMPRGLPYPVAD